MNARPLVLSLTIITASCGGGGGGAPANPAETPVATASADLDGFWRCTESTLVASDTVDVHPFEVGEIIQVFGGQFIGDVTNQQSYLRADIEYELGFLLGWYTNSNDGRILDFGLGYDMIGRVEVPVGIPDYLNHGLRLAVVGADELAGFESSIEQWDSQTSRTQWTYSLRFERVATSPAILEGESSQPYGASVISRFASDPLDQFIYSDASVHLPEITIPR